MSANRSLKRAQKKAKDLAAKRGATTAWLERQRQEQERRERSPRGSLGRTAGLEALAAVLAAVPLPEAMFNR